MAEFNLERLVRPHILSMKPYSSARDEYSGTEGVFLDANENSLGSIAGSDYSRYPDPLQWAVKDKIAKIFDLNRERIFLGNGSDEPIDLLIRAFCRPNIDNILLLPPTYGMYKVSANLNEIAIKNVPLTAEFQLDTEMIFKAIDSYTKIIFICSPNNPTGNTIDKADIQKVVRTFDGIVVVDQAYADFAPQHDITDLLDIYPNLVILRTFSKAWGLAALRLGMALATKEIVALLNKIKPPYNLNIHTQQVAFEVLDRVNEKNESVIELNKLREELCQKLNQLAIVEKIFTSAANFLLVKFTHSTEIFHYLIENKVIVRDRSHELNCENCLRITVGTAAENERLIQLLQNWQPINTNE